MSDVESDVTSDSDTSDVDLTADFDEAVNQIEALQSSYETSLERLQWIQTHIGPPIHPLDAILEELHAEALQEIEKTGESSFGAKIMSRLSRKIEM